MSYEPTGKLTYDADGTWTWTPSDGSPVVPVDPPDFWRRTGTAYPFTGTTELPNAATDWTDNVSHAGRVFIGDGTFTGEGDAQNWTPIKTEAQDTWVGIQRAATGTFQSALAADATMTANNSYISMMSGRATAAAGTTRGAGVYVDTAATGAIISTASTAVNVKVGGSNVTQLVGVSGRAVVDVTVNQVGGELRGVDSWGEDTATSSAVNVFGAYNQGFARGASCNAFGSRSDGYFYGSSGSVYGVRAGGNNEAAATNIFQVGGTVAQSFVGHAGSIIWAEGVIARAIQTATRTGATQFSEGLWAEHTWISGAGGTITNASGIRVNFSGVAAGTTTTTITNRRAIWINADQNGTQAAATNRFALVSDLADRSYLVGSLSVGTATAPSGANVLRVQGTAESTQAAFNVISDKRIKENIEPFAIKDALTKVRKLAEGLSTFNYIGRDDKQVGHIAQEVEAFAPELVKSSLIEWQTGTKITREEIEVPDDEDGDGNNGKRKPKHEVIESSEPIIETLTDGLVIDGAMMLPMLMAAIDELAAKVDALAAVKK